MPLLLVLIFALMFATAPKAVAEPIAPPPQPQPTLSHAQTVWLSALEWCESRGNPKAVNKKDRDGTPSYGAFQFKPSTFASYAGIYHMSWPQGVAIDYMDYDSQKFLVTQMILHRKDINWHQQFPDCVKRLGLPPASESKPQS